MTGAGGVASAAAALTLIGGIGICALALYSLVYPSLRYGLSYTFEELPRLCDLLALATGVLATVLGIQLLRRAIANPFRVGLVLLAIGVPALALTVLAVFPDTFHIDYYSRPFYLGYNYYWDVLHVEVDYRIIPVPLLASLALSVLGGVTMLFAPRRATATPDWR
jgi:hypothetical protein